MKKTERYHDVPLTEQQFKQLDATVIKMARTQLVGRRFIELHGPLGRGIQSIHNDIVVESDTAATVDLQGVGDQGPTVGRQRLNYTIPMLYKDFVLYWRDIEQAKKLGIPLDFSAAADAARQVAQMEDEVIFNGVKEFDVPGLMNVQGRLTHSLTEWDESGKAFQTIVAAQTKLMEKGHNGPFALVVSPQLFSLLHRVHKDTNVLEIDHIRELVSGGVHQSPLLKGRLGVMVAIGIDNLDLVVSEDFDTAYLGEESMNHPFRVYETLVLRIKRPSSICTLE